MTTEEQQEDDLRRNDMEKTAHTPGKWYQHSSGGKTYASVRDANGRCVADFGSRSDTIAQTNAAFIVRACNSFEALVDVAQGIVTAYGDKALPTHVEKHLLDGAREALKTAGLE